MIREYWKVQKTIKSGKFIGKYMQKRMKKVYL